MNANSTMQGLADRLVGDAADIVIGVSLHGKRTVVASGAATPETLFDLASVSKIAGTTAALMALVSSGTLALDGRVSAVIPSFAGDGDSTIRELLQHRAGLWEWQPLYLAPRFGDGVNSVIDGIPLRYRPGSERHYSDLGFIYLGRIIEAATGLGLAEAVEQLVTEPLAMRDTAYRPTGASSISTPRSVAASGHGDRTERAMVATGDPYPVLWPEAVVRAADFAWREHEIVGQVNDGNGFHALGGVAGHAGLFSTVDDLLTLGDALGGQSNSHVPWAESVAREFFTAGPDAEQALGFRRAPIELAGETHSMLWHPGFTGCAIGFVPGLQLGIALTANRLLTADPASTPVPTAQLWQPLVAAAAQLYSPHDTSTRTP